jgi:hypothetical protein
MQRESGWCVLVGVEFRQVTAVNEVVSKHDYILPFSMSNPCPVCCGAVQPRLATFIIVNALCRNSLWGTMPTTLMTSKQAHHKLNRRRATTTSILVIDKAQLLIFFYSTETPLNETQCMWHTVPSLCTQANRI